MPMLKRRTSHATSNARLRQRAPACLTFGLRSCKKLAQVRVRDWKVSFDVIACSALT